MYRSVPFPHPHQVKQTIKVHISGASQRILRSGSSGCTRTMMTCAMVCCVGAVHFHCVGFPVLVIMGMVCVFKFGICLCEDLLSHVVSLPLVILQLQKYIPSAAFIMEIVCVFMFLYCLCEDLCHTVVSIVVGYIAAAEMFLWFFEKPLLASKEFLDVARRHWAGQVKYATTRLPLSRE